MAATLGKDPDELSAELIRAIAQDLADGRSPDELKAALAKRGLEGDPAAKLVDSVVQARSRLENSAEGRAEKRSHAASRMFKGALWGVGGVMVTLMSLGSGGGRIFFGAAIYGAYLFLSGLVLWGGNAAQVGDDEELKKGPGWLKNLKVGSDPREGPTPIQPPAPAIPAAPLPVAVSKPRPLPPPPPASAARRGSTIPSLSPPRAAASPRNWEGTMITRLYAILFLCNQVVELAAPFDPFDEFGLGGVPGSFAVLPSLTFAAGLLCLAHVFSGRLGYRLGVLPAYHLVGVVLIYQLWRKPDLAHGLAVTHSAIGLVGGVAWLWFTEQFRKRRQPLNPWRLTKSGTAAAPRKANARRL